MTSVFVNYLLQKGKEEWRKEVIPGPSRMRCFLALGHPLPEATAWVPHDQLSQCLETLSIYTRE